MKLGIIGSGFGLYGYAIAGKEIALDIFTLERYRKTINDRVDLNFELKTTRFVENEKELIENSDALVVAVNPQNQVKILTENDLSSKRLFLEKPLAHSVESHWKMINLLRDSNIDFSIGYLFQFTKWGELLLSDSQTESIQELSFDWSIAKPDSQWKSDSQLGGGIVKFYGIHILNLLLKMNFDISGLAISVNNGSMYFSDSSIQVRVDMLDLGKDSYFRVSWKSGDSCREFSDVSPFGDKPQFGIVDPRVTCLRSYLMSKNDRESNLTNEIALVEFLENKGIV